MGHKFRRQYPVGPYIVDFACPARRLVVELDGGQHDEAVDAPRTRYLETCGHRILRFWNNDIFERPDTVLAVLLEVLSRLPEPPYRFSTAEGSCIDQVHKPAPHAT